MAEHVQVINEIFRINQKRYVEQSDAQKKGVLQYGIEINPSLQHAEIVPLSCHFESSYELDHYYQLAIDTAEYLSEHLSSNIQLNALAAKMATNRNKLSKAFNAYFGTSVIKWLREQRMKKARELLRNTSMPIQEVAYQVSYENAGNFSSVYRQAFSLSPRQERQRVMRAKMLMHNSKVLMHNSEVLFKKKS